MATILHDSWTEALLRLPETGMGFQVVELQAGLVRGQQVIVGNASEVVERTPGRLLVREPIETAAQGRVVEALKARLENRDAFRIVSRGEFEHRGLARAERSVDGPADAAPVEPSRTLEEFLRFSAFVNDRRILPDGSVRPGTYATTLADGMTVKTGIEAVRRYALPSAAPAVNRFFLKPPTPIPLQRGTVQPANGQPGGGAEVIFTAGSTAGTKYKQDTIPPM